MNYKNGFFQLIIRDTGTYLKLYPAMNGGEAIKLEDVLEYFNAKRIMDYDIKELNKVILTATEPVEVLLNKNKSLLENEYLKITVDPNRLFVIGRFYPPSNGGKLITKEEILRDLSYLGIKHGIIEKNIEVFLKVRLYCTDIPLARATIPVEGKDAEIIYNFNIDKKAKPQLNEDGSVDFHQLDNINHVSEGDVLATLIPEDVGKSGMDVYGNTMLPRKVQRKVLKQGPMIHLSDNGLNLISQVSGHVVLVGDTIIVSNTFEVAADVDTSTGDIFYDGNVYVKGNVRTGFKVEAVGDIIIDGVVEGAELIAGGQIILKRGIQGMNKGKLTAKSNVITKFIENSVVHSGGYITTDCILHSKVSARGDIIVSGKRGFVTGGEVRSGTLIEMKTAGSTMGTQTVLEVGVDPDVLEDFHEKEIEIRNMKEESRKLSQIIEVLKKKGDSLDNISEDKRKGFEDVYKSYNQIQDKLPTIIAEYNVLKEEIEESNTGCVRVRNIAYPGVKLIICTITSFVRSETHYSQFVRDGADVKTVPIS